MNIDKRKLKIMVSLLVFVIVMLFSILGIFSVRERLVKENIVNKAIEGTNWPINDVPLLVNENINVKNLGKYTCQANVESGVLYSEFREYLIELYEAGFEPNKDYGSKNPKNLVSSLNDVELKEVTWIASKDNYEITVIWAEDGAINEFGDEYAYNFDMNLFINPGTSNNNVDNNDKTSFSGELSIPINMSGDIESGDNDSI